MENQFNRIVDIPKPFNSLFYIIFNSREIMIVNCHVKTKCVFIVVLLSTFVNYCLLSVFTCTLAQKATAHQ